MKTEVKINKIDTKFPVLAKSKFGAVFLITGISNSGAFSGMCIYGGRYNDVGEIRSDWSRDLQILPPGSTVTLTQE